MRVLYASHNLVIRGYGFDSKISRALGLKFRTGHILQTVVDLSPRPQRKCWVIGGWRGHFYSCQKTVAPKLT